MNATQIIAVLREAGWPDDGNLLIKMTAIALAESSGNPKAHNSVPPDDSYGLLQINMIGHLGPERLRKYNLSSNADLYNPVVNAEIALDLFHNGRGFAEWGSATHPIGHPRYLDYLSQARKAYDGFTNTNEGDAAQVDNTSDNTLATYSGLGFLAIIIVLGSFLIGSE